MMEKLPSRMLPTIDSCRHTLRLASAFHRQIASQLGTGSGAARRTVIRLAGTQHKILAVGTTIACSTEQFDVIYLFSIFPGDAIARQGFTNPPGKVRQLLDSRQSQFLIVLTDKKEPVATPGDISAIGP